MFNKCRVLPRTHSRLNRVQKWPGPQVRGSLTAAGPKRSSPAGSCSPDTLENYKLRATAPPEPPSPEAAGTCRSRNITGETLTKLSRTWAEPPTWSRHPAWPLTPSSPAPGTAGCSADPRCCRSPSSPGPGRCPDRPLPALGPEPEPESE